MQTYHNATEAVMTLTEEMYRILEQKDHIVLGLPGGRSVKAVFDVLVNTDNVPWDKIHIFLVDERLVNIEDEESNFHLIKEQLINHVDIPEDNIHPFVMNNDKADLGASDYYYKLHDLGGYDIVVLGVGEDGHVGGLYPEHTITKEKEGFLIFHDSPKPPKDRMSASKNLLLRAKLGIGLFLGEGKRDAYEKFKDDEIAIDNCPAKILYDLPKAVVLTDLE